MLDASSSLLSLAKGCDHPSGTVRCYALDQPLEETCEGCDPPANYLRRVSPSPQVSGTLNNMIIPSVLSTDLSFVQEELLDLEQLDPTPQRIQVDIIDGEFAPELTIDAEQLRELNLPSIALDIHFMTLDPTDFIPTLRGMTTIKTVIAQIERLHSQQEFVEEALATHFEAGFSLDLYTPFESLEEIWLSELSIVQIMGGKAGQQGQEFRSQVLEKIQEAAEYKRQHQLKYEIVIDIGMNPDTIPLAKKAGADHFVVGSYLQHGNPQEQWERLLEAEV